MCGEPDFPRDEAADLDSEAPLEPNNAGTIAMITLTAPHRRKPVAFRGSFKNQANRGEKSAFRIFNHPGEGVRKKLLRRGATGNLDKYRVCEWSRGVLNRRDKDFQDF